MDPAQKETATMKTLEITLPVTETTGTVDVLTPAVGRARFASLWGGTSPATGARGLHTSKLWAGVDGVDALAALAPTSGPTRSIEVVGDRGYVLPRGAGRGQVGLLDAVPAA